MLNYIANPVRVYYLYMYTHTDATLACLHTCSSRRQVQVSAQLLELHVDKCRPAEA